MARGGSARGPWESAGIWIPPSFLPKSQRPPTAGGAGLKYHLDSLRSQLLSCYFDDFRFGWAYWEFSIENRFLSDFSSPPANPPLAPGIQWDPGAPRLGPPGSYRIPGARGGFASVSAKDSRPKMDFLLEASAQIRRGGPPRVLFGSFTAVSGVLFWDPVRVTRNPPEFPSILWNP